MVYRGIQQEEVIWSIDYSTPFQYLMDPLCGPKEIVLKDKQRSTNYTHRTKDRVTQAPLKTGDELGCCGRVSSSCSTGGTRCVTLVAKPVIGHEWGEDREVFTTYGTYQWSFVTQIFHSGQLSRGGDRKTFEVMTST